MAAEENLEYQNDPLIFRFYKKKAINPDCISNSKIKKQNHWIEEITKLERNHASSSDISVQQFTKNGFHDLTFYCNKYYKDQRSQKGKFNLPKKLHISRISTRKGETGSVESVKESEISDHIESSKGINVPQEKTRPRGYVLSLLGDIRKMNKGEEASKLIKMVEKEEIIRSIFSNKNVNKAISEGKYHNRLGEQRHSVGASRKSDYNSYYQYKRRASREKSAEVLRGGEINITPIKQPNLRYSGVRNITPNYNANKLILKWKKENPNWHLMQNAKQQGKFMTVRSNSKEKYREDDLSTPHSLRKTPEGKKIANAKKINTEWKDANQSFAAGEKSEDDEVILIRDSSVREFENFSNEELFAPQIEVHKSIDPTLNKNISFVMESRIGKSGPKTRIRLQEGPKESFDLPKSLYKKDNYKSYGSVKPKFGSRSIQKENPFIISEDLFQSSKHTKSQGGINKSKSSRIERFSKISDKYESMFPNTESSTMTVESRKNIGRKGERYIKLAKDIMKSNSRERMHKFLEPANNMNTKYNNLPIIRPPLSMFEEHSFSEVQSHSIHVSTNKCCNNKNYSRWFLPPTQWNDHYKEKNLVGDTYKTISFNQSPILSREEANYRKLENREKSLGRILKEKEGIPDNLSKFMSVDLRKNLEREEQRERESSL